jgi:hypothetical protein
MNRTRLIAAALVLLLVGGIAGLVLGQPASDRRAGGDGEHASSRLDGSGKAGTAATPAASSVIATDGAPAAFASDDRLRVRGSASDRRLTNASGQPVALRGVNVNALVDYGRTHTAPVPIRTRDLAQMAALGFNVMRLAVSWSNVMPAPGKLDRAYLQKIETLVRRAGRQRIYTVISMHSDRYAADLGTGTEFDGAPAWAVYTDGQPCGDPRPRYYTACAAAAARHFYGGESVGGRRGVDWYADAVVAVAAAGRDGGPGYSGIDLINEPTDPDANPDRAATGPWTQRLQALQRNLVRRLRADGERAPVWIQPQGPRSTGATVEAVLPDLGDEDQVVYAPHAYIDVYDGGPNAGTADRMRQQYARFGDEAARLRAATVIGEFPGAAGGPWEALRREHLLRQARAGFGGIAWLWKQPDDGYGWGTLQPGGALRADTNAAQVLSAPRLRAGDRSTQVSTDPDGTVHVQGAARGGPVEVWLGTGFGPEAERRYRLVGDDGGGGATIEQAWRAEATLDGLPAAGTIVRLSVPEGSPSLRFVPQD